MELKSLINKLHPFERTVLPFLKTEMELTSLTQKSGLQEIEVMRALQWLENKEVLKTKSEINKIIVLDNNGLKYQRQGLPEKKFLAILTNRFQTLAEITKKSQLSMEEINASLGNLKKKNAINISKDKQLLIKITFVGEELRQQPLLEELFLHKSFPLSYESLNQTEKQLVEELKKRKEFLKLEEKKTIFIQLTELGKKLAETKITGDVVNRLTPEMLRTGSWKKKQFRAYDVEINVPQHYSGKKHFVTQATEYAKQIWIEMGFKEMKGNMVQTSFWNFDALFTAQDHPVREMQDTYFLGGRAEKGKLPSKKLVRKVQSVHENGGETGSTGWQYKWSEEEAKKNVLRTHTTVLTAQTLAQLKEGDLPTKFFALGKNFRNEALDWNHLNEFNQTEGIVVDENANFCHLLGYLKQFFSKMGFPQARFRPAFFPYTSPSVEIDVYHPFHQKWVEFGGAGMLRPEVVVPLLGKDVPVLAWGPGFDRIILDYWKITDIRDLYKNDLKQLRESKLFLK